MTRKTIAQAYEQVNTTWPAQIPALTGPEAARAARRLYRYALAETYVGDVKITSGNRRSRFYRGELRVNPEQGWKGMVHSLSHWFFWTANPSDKPHSKDHARVERLMIRAVLSRGWLNGALKDTPKPVPTTDQLTAAKLAGIEARVKRWQTKAKRATTALRKLASQQRRLRNRMQPSAVGTPD